MELLWVAFSCSLELLHADMCKVVNVGDVFSLANPQNLVKTGLQGNPRPSSASCSLADRRNELCLSPRTFTPQEDSIVSTRTGFPLTRAGFLSVLFWVQGAAVR